MRGAWVRRQASKRFFFEKKDRKTLTSSLANKLVVFGTGRGCMGSPDRLLPILVAAVVFLAALAGAAGLAAARLADHWRGAVGGTTIQVPEPDAAAAAALIGPAAHRMTQAELAAALQPWLGGEAGRLGFALPAVFTVAGDPPPGLEQALARAAPGTLVLRDTVWQTRLATLASSLQVCAALALGVAGLVAPGVVSVATRAGLAAQRDTVEIVHSLGATDGQIAGSIAAGVSGAAFAGAAAGAVLAGLVLLAMVHVTAPLQPPTQAATASGPGGLAASLPLALWALLAGLPLLATLIGWLTAQATVRSWLRRTP